MRQNSVCRTLCAVVLVQLFIGSVFGQAAKAKLTIDEFFNSVSFDAVKVAPDGNSVLIASEKADWEQQIFRKELWLYRVGDSGGLVQLTQSGQDTTPEWSPDGKWIAFLSDRKTAAGKDSDAEEDSDNEKTAQLYLISPNGGEAFAVTSGSEEVHAFAWSADSKTLYFATREPWSKQQEDDHKKEWKDVKRFRGDERGDGIYRIGVDEAIARHAVLGSREIPDEEKDANQTPGALRVAHIELRIDQMTISRDGKRLAFVSNSVSQRQEKTAAIEVYTVDLANGAAEPTPTRITHNEAVEVNLEWAPDNRHIFFQVNLGSVEGKYVDPQPRLYWVDVETGKTERWFTDFAGEVVRYAVLQDGAVLCSCRLGTEVQMYAQTGPTVAAVKREGWAGAYDIADAAKNTGRIAFAYSATERPTEIYLADAADKLGSARPITAFNKLFTERDLPKAKPYQWKSSDGLAIEGMLMYPPGKFEAKNLPMFVFIHGGPQDADGNRFAADWYQWERLAATAGWLVFEPNYRGSTGYGDKFALAIAPEAFSAPGRDILAGVDALVKDRIADPNQLAVGGYSYGGYMTNWLITQTTRFKAAVTGAGGVENVADWGNDDSTFDDAYFMGGTPWQARENYDREAAIFQIDKVRTPTHMVAGGEDIRVPTLESYLLDRALHELGVPSELLILPGEGHDLSKNPWHGKIKVREELKWLEKYGGVGGK